MAKMKVTVLFTDKTTGAIRYSRGFDTSASFASVMRRLTAAAKRGELKLNHPINSTSIVITNSHVEIEQRIPTPAVGWLK